MLTDDEKRELIAESLSDAVREAAAKEAERKVAAVREECGWDGGPDEYPAHVADAVLALIRNRVTKEENDNT